jgi:UDP-N-acetylmuramate--alanine ligase
MSPTKSSRRAVHFIGIGGIGMSALARYFLSQNWAVSGSDAAASIITEGLDKDAIKAKIGHKKGNLPSDTELVVVSQAITKKNPELREAQHRGLRVLTYPQAVGELTQRHPTIAIAGSHGKSTTTALTGLILMKAGLDPTVIIGTNLKELGGKNFRASKNGRENNLLVLEADEYGRAFYNYFPLVALVTNIDREHLDVYKDLAEAKKAFMRFLGNVQNNGALILNRDNNNLFSLKKDIAALAKKKDLIVIWYSLKDPSTAKIKKTLKIFGEHNVSNATAVYQLGKLMEISEKKILAALGSYGGAWRRMEYRGKAVALKGGAKNARVYDDYAHHPTEVKATLGAVKKQFPKNPLVCVFQPHQGKRLEALFKEFTSAFDAADLTIILPLYKVRGRDEKLARDSAQLVKAINKRSPRKHVVYLDTAAKIPATLNEFFISPISGTARGGARSAPIIIMMGAGDIVNHTQKLLSFP